MAALTAPRATENKSDSNAVLLAVDVQLSAGAVVYNGGLVMTKAGYGRPAAAGVGFVCAGWAELSPGLPSITGGATDGANFVGLSTNKLRVRTGCGWFNNSTSTDQVLQANCGGNALCYLVDDNTVALTSNSGARSVAGVIMEIDTTGKKVLVSISPQIPLNPAIGSGTAFTGAGTVEAISAAGALSVATEVSTLAVTGTTAYTLANGLFIGQVKRVVVISGASTPVGTVTPTTPSGFATVTTLTAKGSGAEFEWAGAGAWYLKSVFGGATVT